MTQKVSFPSAEAQHQELIKAMATQSINGIPDPIFDRIVLNGMLDHLCLEITVAVMEAQKTSLFN